MYVHEYAFIHFIHLLFTHSKQSLCTNTKEKKIKCEKVKNGKNLNYCKTSHAMLKNTAKTKGKNK